MTSQISWGHDGITIDIYSDHEQPNHFRWYHLINFGNYQGDAILFRENHIDKYDDSFLVRMAKAYNQNDKYMLVNDGLGNFKLKKQKSYD